jgi:hypothetical protein
MYGTSTASMQARSMSDPKSIPAHRLQRTIVRPGVEIRIESR